MLEEPALSNQDPNQKGLEKAAFWHDGILGLVSDNMGEFHKILLNEVNQIAAGGAGSLAINPSGTTTHAHNPPRSQRI